MVGVPIYILLGGHNMMRTSIGWLAVLILGAAVMACAASPSVESSTAGSDNASSENTGAAGSEGSAGNEATGTGGSGSTGSTGTAGTASTGSTGTAGTASTGSGSGSGGGAGNGPDCSKPELVCPKEAPVDMTECVCVTAKDCSYDLCNPGAEVKGIFVAKCDGKTWSVVKTDCPPPAP